MPATENEVGLFTAHVTNTDQIYLLIQFCEANGIDYEPDVDWVKEEEED